MRKIWGRSQLSRLLLEKLLKENSEVAGSLFRLIQHRYASLLVEAFGRRFTEEFDASSCRHNEVEGGQLAPLALLQVMQQSHKLRLIRVMVLPLTEIRDVILADLFCQIPTRIGVKPFPVP